jgi:hypothetical protein
MLVAGAALFVALGGTALASTGTVVNIADGTNAARVAHVNASGGLQVAGTVTTQLATPANYTHVAQFNVDSTRGCVAFAVAPTGKALIVRDIRVDVFGDPTPGVGQNIQIYSGASCVEAIGDINPSSIGQVIVPFDPGVALATGESLSVQVFGSVKAEFFVDGYLVPAAQVPAAATKMPTSGGSRQDG